MTTTSIQIGCDICGDSESWSPVYLAGSKKSYCSVAICSNCSNTTAKMKTTIYYIMRHKMDEKIRNSILGISTNDKCKCGMEKNKAHDIDFNKTHHIITYKYAPYCAKCDA